jgi:hypothetical protein
MDHSKATTVLILGILGLTVCAFCAPVAWIMGNGYVKACQAAGVPPQSSGTTGRLLGIIGSVLLMLGVLFGMVAVVLNIVLVVLGGG